MDWEERSSSIYSTASKWWWGPQQEQVLYIGEDGLEITEKTFLGLANLGFSLSMLIYFLIILLVQLTIKTIL